MTAIDKQINIDEIASKVAEKLESKIASAVDHDRHHDHHEWIESQLEKEKEYQALRKKLIVSACLWTIPIILAFTLSAFWNELLSVLKAGLIIKPGD